MARVAALAVFAVLALAGGASPGVPCARERIDFAPKFSADGRLVAYLSGGAGGCIPTGGLVVGRAPGGLHAQLVRQGVGAFDWSPDGRFLVYSTGAAGFPMPRELGVVPSAGTGPPRPLGPGGDPAWSPDGSTIAFDRGDGVYIGGPDGAGARRVAGGIAPAWSPDGRRLAVVDGGVAVVSLDGTSRRLVAREVVAPLVWSPDGTRVAFGDRLANAVDVVDVRSGGVVRVAAYGASGAQLVRPLAWSPDGRALMLTTGDVVRADGSGHEATVPDLPPAAVSADWTKLGVAQSAGRYAYEGADLYVTDRSETNALLLSVPRCSPGYALHCLGGTDRGDRIDGSDLDDIVFAGAGDDEVHGRDGANHLEGSFGRDRLVGGLRNDVLLGQAGADDLIGNAGIDILDGGPGDDTLQGGLGVDTVRGDAGDDRILVRGGGRDLVTCGAGRDTVEADPSDSVAPDCERVSRARPAAAPAATFALLADRTLLRLDPSATRVVGRRSLGAARPFASLPGDYLAARPSGGVYALVPPGGRDRQAVLAVDDGLRIVGRLRLPVGVTFRSITVGPLSGRLFALGERGGEAVAVVLDPIGGGILENRVVRGGDGRHWFVLAGAISGDERRVFVSYHGEDTTGGDWLELAGSHLIRCSRASGPGQGCLPLHGGIAPYGAGVLATTGEGPLVLLDLDGRRLRSWPTLLPGNHLLTFALDRSGKTAFLLGSCGYAGGISAARLSGGTTRLAGGAVCGERIAQLRDGLLLVASNPVPVASGTASRLLVVSSHTGRVLRTLAAPVETLDLLAR